MKGVGVDSEEGKTTSFTNAIDFLCTPITTWGGGIGFEDARGGGIGVEDGGGNANGGGGGEEVKMGWSK
jgi:hypothetical protein